MPVTRAVVVSQQQGGWDGVSETCRHWEHVLTRAGISVTRAAGRIHDPRPGDVILPSLWRPTRNDGTLTDAPPATATELAALAKVARHAVVIMENTATLPTAPTGTIQITNLLTGLNVPIVVRHHDPAWDDPERPDDPRFPLHLLNAAHTTISRHAALELWKRRRIRARVLRPTVTLPPPTTDRRSVRAAIGVADDSVLLLHPVTPYPRKAVHVAASFAGRVAATTDRPVVYWLTGGPQERPTGLPSTVEYRAGRYGNTTDMYAASDAVLLPSTWEGWGLPAAEAGIMGLPVVTGSWPALNEMREMGLRDISATMPDAPNRLLSENRAGATHHQDRIAEELSIHAFRDAAVAAINAAINAAAGQPQRHVA